MSITITLEATRIKCPSCEALLDEGVELERMYECSNCGLQDTERRCYDCNLFMARMEGGSCPECGDLIDDPDGNMVPIITCVCHDEDHEVYA